jgi:hypothetical protein
MILASEALARIEGATELTTQPVSAESHPHAAPSAVHDGAGAAPVTQAQPKAAPAEPPPQPEASSKDGSKKEEEQEEEETQKERPAAINTNSAKAEAKLVKALDYLAGLNDSTDNPAQKWVINESILASLTGCYRPAIEKFVQTQRAFINQANNTHGLGPGHNRGKARTNPDAIPELVKNFKRDALNQPF